MEICDRIKLFRNHLGLDQAEISKVLQIPMRTYGTYERGESKPGSDAILSFVQIGLNANWLLTGVGDMLSNTPEEPVPQQNLNLDKVDTDFLLLCHRALCANYGEQYHSQSAETKIEFCGKLANQVGRFSDPWSTNQLKADDLVNLIKLLIKVGRFPSEFQTKY